MGRRRALLRAAGVAGLAVVLAGCMKIDLDYTVNTDDTVDGTMIMAISRDLAEMSGESDSLVEEMLGEDDIPEGATAQRYEDDDFVGAEYTFDAIPLDELNLDTSDTESLTIVHEGDEFVVSGVMDLSDSGMDDLGDDAGAFGQGFLDSLEIRIAITFPGEIIEANGEIDGTTVVWEPVAGERLDISARAADSGGAGGLPVWAWIVIGLVVVAAIAGLVYVLTRSRAQATDESSDAGAAGAPVGFPPPPAAPPQPGAGATAGATVMGGAAAAEAPGAPASTEGTPDTTGDDTSSTADAVGPVEDVPPAPPAYEQPATADVDASGPDESGAEPGPDAGEGPHDVTGVADGSPSVTPPADAEDGADGDSLQPPR